MNSSTNEQGLDDVKKPEQHQPRQQARPGNGDEQHAHPHPCHLVNHHAVAILAPHALDALGGQCAQGQQGQREQTLLAHAQHYATGLG